ncbi:MAG TPA: hypothetical protein VGD00_09810 [Solirubrobacteraceae bacterium]
MKRSPLTAMLTLVCVLASSLAIGACGGKSSSSKSSTSSTPSTTTKHKSKPAY